MYDVDDSLIHYVKDGDLAGYQNEEDAELFREAFIEAYLNPLINADSELPSVPMPNPDMPLLKNNSRSVPPIDPENDISVFSIVDTMAYLAQDPPITRQYCEKTAKNKDYQSLKRYTINWYWNKILDVIDKNGGRIPTEEEEPGTYKFYSRFFNVYGLLWMAEAFGETQDKLKEAMDAVLKADHDTFDSSCIVFRQYIPFERIVQLFDNPHGWLIDEDLESMMSFRKRDGMPYIAKGMKYEFERALHKQGIYLE